ncbi:MAG: hypothetical protein ACREPK_00040 [Rhodanobacteraceae bacterium]
MHKTAGYHRIHAEGRSHQLRRRIALEAARLISEHGIRDFRMAKRKAAQRIGVDDEGFLPRNREIEEALREHQRLFRADEQPRALRKRREAARDAMRFLERFEPRLVGAVLEGTADTHSPVRLHVFDDVPEDVVGFLREHGIAFDMRARTLRLDRQRSAEFPMLLFHAGNVAVDVTVFPRDALRQAPIDPIDERPQQRASLAALEELLAEGGEAEDGRRDERVKSAAAHPAKSQD